MFCLLLHTVYCGEGLSHIIKTWTVWLWGSLFVRQLFLDLKLRLLLKCKKMHFGHIRLLSPANQQRMSPKYRSRIKRVSYKVPAMTKRTENNYAVVTNIWQLQHLLVIFFGFNRRCTKTFLAVYSWIKITLKQHQQLFFLLKMRNSPTNNNSALSSLPRLCLLWLFGSV